MHLNYVELASTGYGLGIDPLMLWRRLRSITGNQQLKQNQNYFSPNLDKKAKIMAAIS